jgi:putative AdoMet-dependent methyltransferase
MDRPQWQWDEMVQRGTDYEDMAEVEAHDARMAQMRDVAAENHAILELLRLAPEDDVLEIGTGTGAFAFAAARVCRRVYACDTSEAMLAYAARRAQREGVRNIDFRRGGFLTYEHPGEPLSAVVTQLALHHLPDFWKGIALARVAHLLRPGGRLYLRDIVHSFAPGEHAQTFETVLARHSDRMQGDWARHVSREFSTCDWIMEGLLARAGFAIEESEYASGVFAHYLCVKR